LDICVVYEKRRLATSLAGFAILERGAPLGEADCLARDALRFLTVALGNHG
jgi:hypothetical protein